MASGRTHAKTEPGPTGGEEGTERRSRVFLDLTGPLHWMGTISGL
jgi:hypothetical protein